VGGDEVTFIATVTAYRCDEGWCEDTKGVLAVVAVAVVITLAIVGEIRARRR
jgi:hypothetical protein